MTIMARYSGTCPECGERWQPGDLIRSEGEIDPIRRLTVWQHAHCPDTTSARNQPVCPTCWLTHPIGACDR